MATILLEDWSEHLHILNYKSVFGESVVLRYGKTGVILN